MKTRGLLIVFEGLDKSGKSTQAKMLHDKLRVLNMTCELWIFPYRQTASGKILDSY